MNSTQHSSDARVDVGNSGELFGTTPNATTCGDRQATIIGEIAVKRRYVTGMSHKFAKTLVGIAFCKSVRKRTV